VSGVRPFPVSYAFSAATSTFSLSISFDISSGDRKTLAAALFLIFLARSANCKVWTDSSRCRSCLLAVQIRVVLEFPPRASLRSSVSFESRNGTWPLPSVSALMTKPRAVRLRLIFCASLRVLPVAPVLPIRSLPARSTRFSRPYFFDPSELSCL